MPDTGAPYFIPFADPTDLVRDWPALSEDVAEAVADGLDAAGNAGIGSNVVQTVKTNVFTTSSTTYTDVTGLSVTITPSSATSKILVIASVNMSTPGITGNNSIAAQITGGNANTYVGDADGVRIRSAIGIIGKEFNAGSRDQLGNRQTATSQPIVILDSPSTDTPVTYQVQVLVNHATGSVNRVQNNANQDFEFRSPSSIMAIEVAT